jgi:serine protease AprX
VGVGRVGLRAPGSTVDLANPEARVGDRYFRGSGTSMSTAVVAGAAAAHPDWGPDRIKAALTGTADPLAAPSGSGAGALDLRAALAAGTVRPANADLFPCGLPAGPGPRAPPGPTAGADDTAAWAAQPWLSGRWTADGVAAKSWAARSWARSP